jgi:hypothetical protein
MSYRTRIHYDEGQRALMWERWRAGDSLQQIAQLFDRHHGSVRGVFEPTGGIEPAKRRRAATALTLAEREEISRSMVAGASIRAPRPAN